MHPLALAAGLLMISGTLLDGFETILLPRRVSRRFRYSRLYYRGTWAVWRRAGQALPAGRWREAMLGPFGPLSMLGLFASWATSLIVGFGLLHWGLPTDPLRGGTGGVASDLYFSGTTFFTLGLGDVTPTAGAARLLTVVEAGLGFGGLAVVIGYLPVLYQAFSRREVTISLMDARAGSPPAGGEALVRLARDGQGSTVDALLREWEQWAAELLESHISFPVLAYYRSQHANQSWLATLATMLDACGLLLTAYPHLSASPHQAQLTFAMARHAVVDLTLVFGVQPRPPVTDRLPADARQRLHQSLARPGSVPVDRPADDVRLTEIRGLYEPFLDALAAHFLLTLPAVASGGSDADNWQRSAYMPRTPGIGKLVDGLPAGRTGGNHFD